MGAVLRYLYFSGPKGDACKYIDEAVDLMYFCPISALYEKIYPRNHANGVVPVVNFFVCLEVFAYLISNENPIKSTDSLIGSNCTKMCMND